MKPLKETNRQQNIKQRQKQAKEQRMMREYEAAQARLFELAFAYGEGRPITAVEKSVLYAENLPLFTAAEAKRTGHNIVFVELLRANDDVYRVWGENAYTLNAATKGREYATAVVNEAGELVSGVGWGSWPAARPEDFTGYRADWGHSKEKPGESVNKLIPTTPLHRKVIRICNQILTEATAGHSLLMMTVEGNEWDEIKAGWKNKARWDKEKAARYCAIPQGDDTFFVIHNQESGGVSVAEATYGYSKSELYALIRPLVEKQRNIIVIRSNQVVKMETVKDDAGQVVTNAGGKPVKVKVIGERKESKRSQFSQGWGGDYQGTRDKRPDEVKNKESFTVTGIADHKKAAQVLGINLNRRGCGSNILEDASKMREQIQLLIDANLLEPLTPEKMVNLDAFIAEAERRKAEAEADVPTYADMKTSDHIGVSWDNEAGPTAVGEPIFPNGRIRRAQNCIVEVAI